ncbi:hypothetical protein HK104_005767 [Borealophlyctis nickersoniae]|nr:hypothetical protein HK104_005767 [Borealophlyctis nickersoniae]
MNLESCDHITPRGVAAVIGSCERLEQIDLTGLRSFDDDGLHEAFAGVGERLNVVNLSLMGGATGEGIVRGLGHIKGLERLWLQYCGALEDEHVGMLTRVCEKLKDLYFLDCRKFTDQAMLYISNHLNTRLTQLTIGINDLITDHSISTLVRHCPNLRSITLALLRNISDSALHAIATHLPNITEFGVFSAHNITDAGVTSLATNCKNLERLCLYDCNVSSAGLIPVASNLEKLEYINIEHCERIQEATPELLVIWKRCDDFLANRALIRALHHYEFICAAADMHGVDKPVHLTFEFV